MKNNVWMTVCFIVSCVGNICAVDLFEVVEGEGDTLFYGRDVRISIKIDTSTIGRIERGSFRLYTQSQSFYHMSEKKEVSVRSDTVTFTVSPDSIRYETDHHRYHMNDGAYVGLYRGRILVSVDGIRGKSLYLGSEHLASIPNIDPGINLFYHSLHDYSVTSQYKGSYNYSIDTLFLATKLTEPYFPSDYDTISQWHLSFAALSDKGVDTIRSEIIDNNETDFITWNIRDISWSDIPAKIHRDSNGYGLAYFYVQAVGKNGTLYNDFMPVRITPEGDDFSVGIHRNHRKVSVPGRLHIRNEKEIMYVDPLGRICPLNSINKRAFTIHKKSEGAKTGVLRIY